MNFRISVIGTILVSILWLAACTVPSWVNTAESDAMVAVPIAASLVDVIDPALAPVVTLAENGFNALVKTLDTYKASPTATNLQAVQSAFAAVNQNVAQLESAAQIKNATTATTVSAVVQLLAQAVTEIAALVPANSASSLPKSPAGSAGPVSPTAKGWKAKDFKREYNRIVKGDPRFKPLK